MLRSSLASDLTDSMNSASGREGVAPRAPDYQGVADWALLFRYSYHAPDLSEISTDNSDEALSDMRTGNSEVIQRSVGRSRAVGRARDSLRTPAD